MKKVYGLSLVLLCLFVLSSCQSKEHIHKYSTEITEKADCCHNGIRTYQCLECGEKYNEEIIGDHQYVDTYVAPADNGEGYLIRQCEKCGKTEKSSLVGEYPSCDLRSAEISEIEKHYDFTGEKVQPTFHVEDAQHNILKENIDYVAEFENNVDIGTASLVLQGIGSYYNRYVKEFEIVNRRWETIDGNRYYYDGDLVTGLYEIENKYYYFNEDGVMQTGWQEIGGAYYCFNRLTGILARSTTVDGICVDDSGKAEISLYNSYKIQTMMKAHQIMLEQTLPTDSMEEKRLKLFKWEAFEHGYHRWRLLSDIYKTSPDWEMTFANDIFQYGSGCCVSDACAGAFLMLEIGYTDIYVCHDTSHCWFSVGGKLFDPLFSQQNSFEKNYNADFADYRAYPAGRVRIDGARDDV